MIKCYYDNQSCTVDSRYHIFPYCNIGQAAATTQENSPTETQDALSIAQTTQQVNSSESV